MMTIWEMSWPIKEKIPANGAQKGTADDVNRLRARTTFSFLIQIHTNCWLSLRTGAQWQHFAFNNIGHEF